MLVCHQHGGSSALLDPTLTKEAFIQAVNDFEPPNAVGNAGRSCVECYNKYFKANAGNFFDIASNYNLDPRFIFCIGIHESYYGTSNIANEKGNFFGWGANDSNPYGDAHSFADMSGGIEAVCKGVANNYVSSSGDWYQWIMDKGYNPSTIEGIGARYASDQNWAKGVLGLMSDIFGYVPMSAGWVGDIPANASFLEVAKIRHDYIRLNNYYYSSAASVGAGQFVKDATSVGSSVPKPVSGEGTYIDCSAYVTDVLYCYGYTEYGGWQKSTSYYMNKSTMEQKGWSVRPASQAQAGDIVVNNGHMEIYAGNGQFYNAGSTNAIRSEISNSGVGRLNDFTYAITVTPPSQ